MTDILLLAAAAAAFTVGTLAALKALIDTDQ